MYLLNLTNEEKLLIEKALCRQVTNLSREKAPEAVISVVETLLLKIAKIDKEQG